jgi:hypothetical protein
MTTQEAPKVDKRSWIKELAKEGKRKSSSKDQDLTLKDLKKTKEIKRLSESQQVLTQLQDLKERLSNPNKRRSSQMPVRESTNTENSSEADQQLGFVEVKNYDQMALELISTMEDVRERTDEFYQKGLPVIEKFECFSKAERELRNKNFSRTFLDQGGMNEISNWITSSSH